MGNDAMTDATRIADIRARQEHGVPWSVPHNGLQDAADIRWLLDQLTASAAALAEARQEIATITAVFPTDPRDGVTLLDRATALVAKVQEAHKSLTFVAALEAEAQRYAEKIADQQDALAALRAEYETLRTALVKVRAHTGYTIPTSGKSADLIALLSGLLQSVERIADAALLASPQEPR